MDRSRALRGIGPYERKFMEVLKEGPQDVPTLLTKLSGGRAVLVRAMMRMKAANLVRSTRPPTGPDEVYPPLELTEVGLQWIQENPADGI